MNTTLNKIRVHSPCADGYKKLLQHLGKTQADDEPLLIATVLDSNGLDDALWCLQAVTGHDREIRLYAVWCARQAQHLRTDPHSLNALDVAEQFANGQATADELANVYRGSGAARVTAAADAAWAARVMANAAASWAADAAATKAVGARASWAAAADAAASWTAAREDTRAKQAGKLRELCAGVAI